MEIEYKGANCLSVSTKRHVIITDPKLSLASLKDFTGKPTVQLVTQTRFALPETEGILLIDSPGEYEADGLSVVGVAAASHTDDPLASKGATIFRLEVAGMSLAFFGHVAPELTEDQLEAIGLVDILAIPVGGGGYTLDAHEAVRITRQLDPKIVIPTHYAEKGIHYEVPQDGLDVFLNELGAPHERLPKIKLKNITPEDTLKICVLNRG